MALFQVSSITMQQIGGDAVRDAVRVSVSNSMMVLKLLSNSSAFYRPLRWCSYFVENVVSWIRENGGKARKGEGFRLPVPLLLFRPCGYSTLYILLICAGPLVSGRRR